MFEHISSLLYSTLLYVLFIALVNSKATHLNAGGLSISTRSRSRVFRARCLPAEVRHERVEHIGHLHVRSENVFRLELLLARRFRPERVRVELCWSDLQAETQVLYNMQCSAVRVLRLLPHSTALSSWRAHLSSLRTTEALAFHWATEEDPP